MYKITNIETLGTDYTIANKEGKIISNVQVIPHTEILEAASGYYNELEYDMSTYIAKTKALFAGNENIDPHSILWYSTEDDEVPLDDVIEYAVLHGYTTIILEHLDPVFH
jgi:hypothetical protein